MVLWLKFTEKYAAIEHSKYNQACIVDWRGGHGPGELPRCSGIKAVNRIGADT